ncbi:tudor domain-containing protein 7 [Nilaparvata lugens]|uniref:tudor domain-containing protein 7 n=1 Tax=Nilaparvata lugens TaxID=108931 RepID=UPI00193D80D7|nr:tudor domain-containing protein 7 [Nilaparvata lugens]
MVNVFPGGVWANEVAKTYALKYNETLPENWLTMLASCPALSMSATINGEVVLYADTTRLQQQQQAEDVADINEAELRLSNSEIHSPLEQEIVPITETVLPSDNCWDVFISNLESSNAVYVRLIGEQYSGKYESMIDEMERYYSEGFGSRVPLEAIEIGLLYVGQLNDAWFRVCVYDILEDDQHFNCLLIDVGEWEKIKKCDVYYMERQFCRLQRQAVLCSLAEIDKLEDDVLYNEIHELLFGKVFVATVDSRDDDSNEYSVTLHDTSVDPNVNINKKIRNLIDSMHQPLNLLKSSVIKEVYVSHIKENGNLFVQLQTPHFDELTKLCQQLDEQHIVTHRVPSAALLTKDKRYLAKFSADGEYYRTALTGEPAPHDNEVEMMFIDFGNVEKVNVADISKLEVLSPALYKIHPQAVEVKLHEVTVDQTGYKKLKELIPVSEMVLVRVLDDACAPPEVEVFRRHVQADGTNQLVSVNSTIAFEQSLAKTNQLRRSIRRKGEVTSAAPQAPSLSPNGSPPRITNNKIPETVHHKLVAPHIPDNSSEFFDVYILLAVNPTNFMIQPLTTVRKLGELTCEMTRFYQQHAGQFAVRSDDLIVGGLYAALSDGEFLRVTLASKVDSTMLSVYVCDSGDYRIVDVDDLRYLDASFTKLPYQAVKATLFGIRAVDGDWSTESCFFFQRLVVEKDLVSVVKERIPDPQGKHPFMLSLILIDTSGVEDINIRHELVKNNIAVLTVNTQST